jgi:hypothetical protein
MGGGVNWMLAHHFHPAAVRLADLHYSRRASSVGTPQMMPPGRKLVMVTEAGDAVFGVSWPFPELVAHDWPNSWLCTIFRRQPECPTLASSLIREALAVCRWKWPDVPELGMITFVNAKKVGKPGDNPGYCFLKAGFHRVADSRTGLVTLHLPPAEMPEPAMPLGATFRLELSA